ncbi:37S ribosomal protein S9, mitochondrial, partial [Massospora cicadina]
MDLCVSRYTKQIPYFAKKPTIDMIRKPEDRFMSWFSKNRMEKHVGSLLTETQYNSIIARLEQLAGDSPEDFNTLPAELQTYLLEFTHTSKVEFEKFQPKPLDNLGRAYACGRRKEATAQVWLVKGDGKVVINGRPLASYFIRMVDREDVLLPFSVTSTLGKYNAWVKAYGGGTT